MIGKNIPVIKEHPFVTADGLKAQEIKTEEIKAKTKENKIYRGSRTNGDFWRRKSRLTGTVLTGIIHGNCQEGLPRSLL